METPVPSSVDRPASSVRDPLTSESQTSAVSWSAVLAGAFVAAALALIMIALGTGLGLSVVSPWSNAGASASTVGTAALAWIIIMQLLCSGMGGYLAGRLRTKWVNVHTDEVFFRDTAHGFLAWSVGIVGTAAFLTSAATFLVGGVAQGGATGAVAGAGLAANAAVHTKAQNTDTARYVVDSLFRSNPNPNPNAGPTSTLTTGPAAAPTTASNPTSNTDDSMLRGEVGRIFSNGMGQTEFPAADKTYLAQQIAARTGVSQADADKRVSDAIAQAKAVELKAREAADAARKGAAHLSLWTFLAFLIGAFSASYAATIGGRQRDHLYA